jgi:hypothetical protein
MKRTRVTEPIDLVEKSFDEKSKCLLTFLEKKNYDDLTRFEDFLMQIELTEDEYIQLIQCTIKQPAIFLIQRPSHIWNNSFTKEMPNLWNANTNAQYVLDAYVATSYCGSYMTKVDKSMTNAFRRIRKECEKNNINAIQMIHTLGNTLLNLQQISSQ